MANLKPSLVFKNVNVLLHSVKQPTIDKHLKEMFGIDPSRPEHPEVCRLITEWHEATTQSARDKTFNELCHSIQWLKACTAFAATFDASQHPPFSSEFDDFDFSNS